MEPFSSLKIADLCVLPTFGIYSPVVSSLLCYLLASLRENSQLVHAREKGRGTVEEERQHGLHLLAASRG
jgi:hypothetical protein